MWRPILILLALLVSGCNLGTASRSVSARPSEVHAFAGVCSAPVPDLSPTGYTIAGFDFVDEQCGLFFDGVIELAKNSRFASSSIATANTQAALIMAAVDAAAKSIAIVAASSELARKLIDGYAAEYAFSPYALEVRQLVVDALSAYRADSKTGDAINALATFPSTGDAYCLANNIVRNYAKICSVANVEGLARQAVANSKVTKSGPAAGNPQRMTVGFLPSSAGAPAPGAMRRATSEELTSFRRGLALPNYTAGKP